MALAKREKKAEGTTFLAYGLEGTGKTPLGLSFRNQFLVDSDSGTKFYDGSNVVIESSTLSFKELNDDLDEFENDEELFSQVETIVVDSITRFHENMQHAALSVVEDRAIKNGRLIEGEGLSTREYGIMKLHYDRFFARMLTYAKMGKNIVFIAEQKDKTENRTNTKGDQVSVKVGVMPNMQKDSKFDFDVVVRTYTEDGKPKGAIEKDRTGTFKIGDVVDKPNFSHWEKSIEKALSGRKRNKSEITSFDESISKEAKAFDTNGGNVQELHTKMKQILVQIKDQDFKDNIITPELQNIMGIANFLKVSDTAKLEKALKYLEGAFQEYKNKQ